MWPVTESGLLDTHLGTPGQEEMKSFLSPVPRRTPPIYVIRLLFFQNLSNVFQSRVTLLTKDDVARSVHTVKASFYYAELCFCVTFFHSMYYLKPTIFHFSHK